MVFGDMTNIGIKPEAEKLIRDIFGKGMEDVQELVTTFKSIDKSLRSIRKHLATIAKKYSGK